MTKQQLITDIQRLNRSARWDFLIQFDRTELDLYLRRLLRLERKYDTSDLLRPVPLRELRS